ncbi:MAG: nitroreductase family protein [Thermoleophilia bacterium]|nr:nitroreductase family protein [Thermoleophilia bacterium]
MDALEAIRQRRTVKTYLPEPVPREQLERVLDAAKWAPCHRMSEPWRFRVIGAVTLGRLVSVAGGGAGKLMRAPTLVVASYVPSPLPLHAAEDEQAAACAVYAVLLAAEAEGLASYWRTPGILRSAEGRAALQLPSEERTIGLLHFGTPRTAAPEAPARQGTDAYVTWLD